MEPLSERLAIIQRHVEKAAAATQSIGSPVLAAVVGELAKKAHKLSGEPSRETIVEVEQAGDSAKAAANADPAASDEVKRLVTLAHDSLCMLKHEYGEIR
ncbi:MAG: hypothetical protein ABI678_18960 [Kofleriaceae bacterium]